MYTIRYEARRHPSPICKKTYARGSTFDGARATNAPNQFIWLERKFDG